MAILFPFLLASPIYATLLVYAIWSWRRLQSGIPFPAQVRRLMRGVIVCAAIWLLLSLMLAGLTAVLYLGAPDQQLAALGIATFVPYIPYYPAALLVELLHLLGLPYESDISGWIGALSTIVTAPLLLLLISFIELRIMRLMHRNTARVNDNR